MSPFREIALLPPEGCRGFPGRPRVALSRVSDPPGLWVGVREPRGRLGGRYTKNVTICPTHRRAPHLEYTQHILLLMNGRADMHA
jgi:hypothetical protein